MTSKSEFRFQAASALYLGQRENQEDALASDFSVGGDLGFVVLSDGMGGHNAGDIASKVVVTEVFSELKLQSGDEAAFEDNVTEILRNATDSANLCVREVSDGAPAAKGMGATLVVPVFVRDQLFWISVGDSLLYLLRDGQLTRLNEDHSMAPQIDFMVQSGLMTERTAREHPNRSCLTSVLVGEHIAKIDCPDAPLQLQHGDIVLVASDGLLYLSSQELQDTLMRKQDKSSEEIVDGLIKRIKMLDAPDQDNVSLTVVKVIEPTRKSEQIFPELHVSENTFLAEKPTARTTETWASNLRNYVSRLFLSAIGPT